MKIFILVMICSFILVSGLSWAAEPSFKRDEPLNGMTIHYKYTHGWEFELSFYDNQLKYYALREDEARPSEPTNKDIPYHAIQIGDNMYMLNWHETNTKDVVTLVINFNTSTIYGAGLVGYDKALEDQVHFFHGAIIQSVKKD